MLNPQIPKNKNNLRHITFTKCSKTKNEQPKTKYKILTFHIHLKHFEGKKLINIRFHKNNKTKKTRM